MTTHSPCRGELSSLACAESLPDTSRGAWLLLDSLLAWFAGAQATANSTAEAVNIRNAITRTSQVCV
jgi:hypothetical protein